MSIELWTSRDLLELRQDLRLDPVPDYFQRTFFNTDFYSEDREILIADLPKPYRKLAPFVMPTSQGKPIFERRGEKVSAMTPPYIKLKDAVRVTEARNVLPSQIWRNGPGLPSLQERFDGRVADVQAFHLRAINMQKAWMAARAIIDGQVTIQYAADQGQAYPEVTISYGRAANHTIALSGSFWSDPNYDIIGDLTTWSQRMYQAEYGVRPTDVIVGAEVAPFIQRNVGIQALLSTQRRGGEDTSMSLGLLALPQAGDNGPVPIARIGGIGMSLNIWTYKDVVEAPNGSMVDILHPKDVFMFGPGASGVMAHGAIYDVDAFEGGNISTDVFSKMFKDNDPGDMYVMNQSSPLPIVTYPNRTLKARVLA